ncbi:Cell division protein FtsK [Candidatus Palibaumannia cicadellinicola]|uniref:Cell division protein FtsK n=1 Tax=Candidatus Palibaumannia cicadellinicola TaxID=186490 RepID=A0A088MY10_9GAMM|nr:Cell division protein FtsK [Candidatus Baumannia cicadellinicola]
MCIVAYYLIAVLVSFDPYDPSWLQISSNITINNIGGKTGAWLADTLLFFWGILAYIIPFLILFACYLAFIQRNYIDLVAITFKIISIFILLVSSCGLTALQMNELDYFYCGGIIGNILSNTLLLWLDHISATLLLLCFLVTSLTLLTGWYWLIVINAIGLLILKISNIILYYFSSHHHVNQYGINNNDHTSLQRRQNKDRLLPFARKTASYYLNTFFSKEKKDLDHKDNHYKGNNNQIKICDINLRSKNTCVNNTNIMISQELPLPQSSIELPIIDLLRAHKREEKKVEILYLKQTARLVESCLAGYRIQVKVVGVFPGPVITRFELDLAPGVKVAQISSLSRDIARALSTNMVQIVEIIPGKPYIGLDIPNKQRHSISLREVFDCDEFSKVKSPLSLVLGQDIRGQTVIVDLMQMPHVLIAGTTGSGKSVGINAMILSILYKATPQKVRFIMIDPKMLELSVYEGIPHLLTKVVTNMNDAKHVLLWCINEMERRYKLMSAFGVRNLTNYNKRIKQVTDRKQNDYIAELDALPYIVIVVDELADLMMMLGKKIEELIVRLAQKARASGIHLVLATQRPSVDVITGLIKANIPTRIAFTVSSTIDSRTILDKTGAESLLGMGDMLYLASHSSLPIRVHGAFVQDEEVHAVVNYLKQQKKTEYLTIFNEE